MATFPYPAQYPDGTPYPVIPAGSTVVNVSSSSALTTAIANAQPGHRIVLANGTYSGALTITGKNGTSSAGISIEAANVGGAVFASGSTITVKDSSYVTIKGLLFPYELSSGNLVQFRGTAHHCRVTRCRFGPTSIGSPGTNKAPFVYMGDDTQHIRVDHCEFRNKANPGNTILGDGNFESFQVVRYIRIDHNWFHDIRPEVPNEKEPIRLGVSTMSKKISNSVIERNRFENCICEPEIVSAKAGAIRITGNTVVKSIGGLVYRHGINGVMSDNYIVDRANTFGDTIGSGGFRFYDSGHEVDYNYVDGVVGGNFQGPLLLDTGDAEGSSTNLSAHWRVVNAKVRNNLIIDSPEGVRIGDNYSSAPTGCTITDNVVVRVANGQAVTQLIAPVNTTMTGNTYFATPTAGGLTQDSAGIWRKTGAGPRLTFLQVGDTGVDGDLNDSDGTGALVSGGGGPTPDPDPEPDPDPPPPAGDQTTAAGRYGWGQPLAVSDEFNYTGPPDPNKWKLPGADWAGHSGNGTRDPERMEVRDGRLIMTGLANGSSGWMQHKFDQQYGRWEGRCRSRATATSNGNDYHPLFLLWPTSNSRQQDGEYDFLENGAPGEDHAGAFLHYPHPGTTVVQQIHFERPNTDLTQWHNFALEWTPDHLKLFCDGELWGTASGGANSVRRNIQDMPSGHLCIQLDNFDGTNQTPAVFEVEWIRVYTLTPTAPPVTSQTVAATGIPSGQAFGLPTITGAEPEPPPNSHPTLLGTGDTVLGTTILGYTAGEGSPPPAGGQAITRAGAIVSGQAFGLPLVEVEDGPQTVRGVGVASGERFGHPAVAAGLPPGSAPGGVLVPSIWAVGPDGKLTPLTSWTKLSVAPVRNSPGSFTIEYPAGSPGFSTLYDGVSAHPFRVLEVQIWLGGNQTGALGGWLVAKSGDDLTPGASWSFSGHFHEWLLSKAIVAPQEKSEANPKGELRFSAATTGLVLKTVVDQAKARGALPLVTIDFTATHDSKGKPWALTVSSLTFSPKTTVLQVADELVKLGMLEYELTPARVLRAYAAETRGTDRTGGANPLTFGHAVNLEGHARRETSKDAGTAVLAAGSEGFYSWAESATARAELGWRAEVGADAGQLSSQDAVQAYAATHLEAIRHGVAEHTGDVQFGPTDPLPLLHWGVGDWCYTWVNGQRRKLRIAQVTLEFARGVPPTGTVTLNDLITDRVTALYRRLDAISAGGAVVGTSAPTPGGAGEDRNPPAAPTGLTLSSNIAYQLPGETVTRALVSAGWTAVITDAYPDAATAGKAQAAELIARQLAAALAAGTAGDAESLGKTQAAGLIANRLTDALAGRANSVIAEDWSWTGMPSVVDQFNELLLADFADAGFSGVGITLSVQARDWLKAYGMTGPSISEDWVWNYPPAIVDEYRARLIEEFEDAFPDTTSRPSRRSRHARDWLAAYPAAHQGGGAVSGDVDHYRVQFRYLGARPVTNVPDGTGGEAPPLDSDLPVDLAWVEPVESPTRSTSVTLGDIEGGRTIGVRVAAVDRADNQGPWSAEVAVDTAVDDQPPPVPSAPLGSPWFRTADWYWDGKGASGEDMLAAAPDFEYVELHVDLGQDFIPDRPSGADGKVDLSQSGTFVALLYAGGTWNQANLTIGATYYARLVAVDRAGNASEPSASSNGVLPQQLVNIDIGPGAIARQQIIDGEIVRAKIADAAINSAKVEEIEVGKLTAGTMTANVIIGGRFSTPTVNGNKIEIDNAGIRLFQGSTVVGRWTVADASMLVTGTYLSGLNGERINLLPDGTMRFYGSSGVDYAQIANDGAILRMRSRADATGRRSYIDFDPTSFRARYGTETVTRSEFHTGETYGVLTAGVVGTRVDRRFTPTDATAFRAFWTHSTNGLPSGDISASVLHYIYDNGQVAIAAPLRDVGVRWDNTSGNIGDGRIYITDGLGVEGSGDENMRHLTCRSLTQTSSQAGKRDIELVGAVLPPGSRVKDLVRQVQAKSWKPREYDLPARRVRINGEKTETIPAMPPDQVPVQVGLIAEELEAVAPALVHRVGPDGQLLTIAPMEIAAVAWSAAGEAHDDIDALTTRLAAVEAVLGNRLEQLTARVDNLSVAGIATPTNPKEPPRG